MLILLKARQLLNNFSTNSGTSQRHFADPGGGWVGGRITWEVSHCTRKSFYCTAISAVFIFSICLSWYRGIIVQQDGWEFRGTHAHAELSRFGLVQTIPNYSPQSAYIRVLEKCDINYKNWVKTIKSDFMLQFWIRAIKFPTDTAELFCAPIYQWLQSLETKIFYLIIRCIRVPRS